MSGAGVGDGFAVFAYLVGGAFYLAGKAIFLAGKGAYKAGKCIYAAYKKHEEKRIAEAQQELASVQNELGQIAQARQQALKNAEIRLMEQCDSAMERHQALSEKAYSHLDQINLQIETAMMEIPAYFNERQKQIQAYAESEIDRFSTELEDTCRRMKNEIATAMDKKKEEVLSTVSDIENYLESREKKYFDYISDTKESATALLTALRNCYRLEEIAYSEIQSINEAIEFLNRINEQDDKADLEIAVSEAAVLAGEILSLQVVAELRTAEFNHRKANLDVRAEELRIIAEATHNLTEGCEDKMINDLVTDIYNAGFWSDGELPRLWTEADELQTKVGQLTYENVHDSTFTEIEFEKRRMELEKAHARVRARLLSHAALLRLKEDVIESMEENSWMLSGEIVDYLDNDVIDIREPIRLVFKCNEDERTIILYDEYDEETKQYKQCITRLCNEEETVSETQRQKIDENISKSLRKRHHTNFSFKCIHSSEGMKKRLSYYPGSSDESKQGKKRKANYKATCKTTYIPSGSHKGLQVKDDIEI